MYDDSCLNKKPCSNALGSKDSKCLNCQLAWFVNEMVDGIWVEIRYSFNDRLCLSWMFEWAQFIPIPGETLLTSDTDNSTDNELESLADWD